MTCSEDRRAERFRELLDPVERKEAADRLMAAIAHAGDASVSRSGSATWSGTRKRPSLN